MDGADIVGDAILSAIAAADDDPGNATLATAALRMGIAGLDASPHATLRKYDDAGNLVRVSGPVVEAAAPGTFDFADRRPVSKRVTGRFKLSHLWSVQTEPPHGMSK